MYRVPGRCYPVIKTRIFFPGTLGVQGSSLPACSGSADIGHAGVYLGFLAVDIGVINSGRCRSPAQRKKTTNAKKKNGPWAFSGRQRPVSMIKTCAPHMSATAQAPTQHEASLLRAEAESGHNTGWKMPNAQVMACGACLTNTYQSRMAWRWHAYRWPDGTP